MRIISVYQAEQCVQALSARPDISTSHQSFPPPVAVTKHQYNHSFIVSAIYNNVHKEQHRRANSFSGWTPVTLMVIWKVMTVYCLWCWLLFQPETSCHCISSFVFRFMVSWNLLQAWVIQALTTTMYQKDKHDWQTVHGNSVHQQLQCRQFFLKAPWQRVGSCVVLLQNWRLTLSSSKISLDLRYIHLRFLAHHFLHSSPHSCPALATKHNAHPDKSKWISALKISTDIKNYVCILKKQSQYPDTKDGAGSTGPGSSGSPCHALEGSNRKICSCGEFTFSSWVRNDDCFSYSVQRNMIVVINWVSSPASCYIFSANESQFWIYLMPISGEVWWLNDPILTSSLLSMYHPHNWLIASSSCLSQTFWQGLWFMLPFPKRLKWPSRIAEDCSPGPLNTCAFKEHDSMHQFARTILIFDMHQACSRVMSGLQRCKHSKWAVHPTIIVFTSWISDTNQRYTVLLPRCASSAWMMLACFTNKEYLLFDLVELVLHLAATSGTPALGCSLLS